MGTRQNLYARDSKEEHIVLDCTHSAALKINKRTQAHKQGMPCDATYSDGLKWADRWKNNLPLYCKGRKKSKIRGYAQ